MIPFDVVASAWMAAVAGVLAPSLLFVVAERTAKSVSFWMHGAQTAVSSRLGPLSHH